MAMGPIPGFSALGAPTGCNTMWPGYGVPMGAPQTAPGVVPGAMPGAMPGLSMGQTFSPSLGAPATVPPMAPVQTVQPTDSFLGRRETLLIGTRLFEGIGRDRFKRFLNKEVWPCSKYLS